MRYAFPQSYGQRTLLVEIDASMVPIVAGALRRLEYEHSWETWQDYLRGYNAIARIQADMMGVDMRDLLVAINRLYMSQRQLFAGEEFVAVEGGAQPELPNIPPELPGDTSPGMLAILRDVQGLQSEGLFGIGQDRASLADVWRALQPSTEQTVQHWADKLDLLGDATDVSSLYRAFQGTVTDAATLAEGGGALMASIVGQATIALLMTSQIEGLKQVRDSLALLVERLGAVPTSAGADGISTIAESIDAARVMLQGN